MDETLKVKQENSVANRKGNTVHTLLLPAFTRHHVSDEDMKRDPKRYCSRNALVRMLLLTAYALTRHDARAHEKEPKRDELEKESINFGTTLQ